MLMDVIGSACSPFVRWSDISRRQPSVNAICTACADWEGTWGLPSNQLYDLLPLLSVPSFTANKTAASVPAYKLVFMNIYSIFQAIPNTLLVFIWIHYCLLQVRNFQITAYTVASSLLAYVPINSCVLITEYNHICNRHSSSLIINKAV